MELIKYSLVYTADSIRKFDSKSNRTADSIQDLIRTQKKTIRRSLLAFHVYECVYVCLIQPLAAIYQ